MFKSLATAAAIFLATATASLASTGWSTGDVNMRQGPGTGYYTVGAIPRCASFTVYAEDRGWYQVNWRGIVGWVSGRYVAYNDNHCGYQAPAYQAPVYHAPAYRAPSYQPQYQAPSYGGGYGGGY